MPLSQPILRFKISHQISTLILLLSGNLFVIPSASAEHSTTAQQFIQDVQLLLHQNQQFYTKYGTWDPLINLKFFEAKQAAEEIFQRPDIFEEKILSLQKLINGKLSSWPSFVEHSKLDPAFGRGWVKVNA